MRTSNPLFRAAMLALTAERTLHGAVNSLREAGIETGEHSEVLLRDLIRYAEDIASRILPADIVRDMEPPDSDLPPHFAKVAAEFRRDRSWREDG